MKVLITGCCGFLGTNVAIDFLKRGFSVYGFDNLSRYGSELNKSYLSPYENFEFYHGDIRKSEDIESVIIAIKPEIILHLAGQVAMTTSLLRPRYDFEVNTIGTINVLEAIRKYSKGTSIIYSSTNKVYGDMEYLNYKESETRYICSEYPDGFSEQLSLAFESPYGCSKGAAEQYILDYSKMFGISGIVLRHSSMYGGRQFATADQGWIGWFCRKAINQKLKLENSFEISGSGKQVRDLLHADDMCDLYYTLAKNASSLKGQVFNVGGGMKNSLSLLELFKNLNYKLDTELVFTQTAARKSDQKIFVADTNKLNRLTGWSPKVTYHEGLNKMLDWTYQMIETEKNDRN